MNLNIDSVARKSEEDRTKNLKMDEAAQKAEEDQKKTLEKLRRERVWDLTRTYLPLLFVFDITRSFFQFIESFEGNKNLLFNTHFTRCLPVLTIIGILQLSASDWIFFPLGAIVAAPIAYFIVSPSCTWLDAQPASFRMLAINGVAWLIYFALILSSIVRMILAGMSKKNKKEVGSSKEGDDLDIDAREDPKNK